MFKAGVPLGVTSEHSEISLERLWGLRKGVLWVMKDL